MKALLVLENGRAFQGVSVGVPGERVGEVVLNTAVVGYQESLTDPTNAGKMVVFTYPLIGNYGVARKFCETKRAWPAGFIIKELSPLYSNWQAEGRFDDFVRKEKLVALSEADTRTLAITIRDEGQMLGIVSTKETNANKLLKKLTAQKAAVRRDYVREASVRKPTSLKPRAAGPRVAVLDLGVLKSFLRQLRTLGCSLTLLPYNTPPANILAGPYDGLIISNGPEDDMAIPEVAANVAKLIGQIPMLGIAVGHEIIALALGVRVEKMKLGHHGVNYPVIKPGGSFKGDITVQNHSYVVNEKSLRRCKDVTVTLRNLNDSTIEEMESRRLKFISTQYYPASPGFDEVNGAFKRFLSMTKSAKGR